MYLICIYIYVVYNIQLSINVHDYYYNRTFYKLFVKDILYIKFKRFFKYIYELELVKDIPRIY